MGPTGPMGRMGPGNVGLTRAYKTDSDSTGHGAEKPLENQFGVFP